MTKKKTPDNDLSSWVSDIDVKATQELIDQLQAEGKPWFKFDIGKGKYVANYIRICPKRPNWQNPYQVTPVHYLGPNRRMVVCLKESGRATSCPACELRWELHEADMAEESRALRTSLRTFLNVVKLNKDGSLAEDKVYLLGLNQLQFMGKRGVEYDPDEEGELPLYNFFQKYGDLSHVVNGRDLLVKCKEDKSGDYDVTAMKFSVADPTAFPGTSAMLEEGLSDITDVATLMEPADIVATIQGQSEGAVPPTVSVATLPPPAVDPAPANGRFGEEEPETVDAEVEEVDPKASPEPPKTDPGDAIKRLRERQAKE